MIALIIVLIMAVAYVWYATKYHKYYDENAILDLSGEDNQLVVFPIDNNPVFDNRIVASELLKELFDLNVSYTKIAVAQEINDKYVKITGKKLKKVLFLRDIIGFPCEIAIISNKNIRKSLHDESYNLNFIKIFLENDKLKDLSNAFDGVLKTRWALINELDNVQKYNDNGSFLYIKNFGAKNIKGYTKKSITRLNLLCSNFEFNNLITRMKSLSTTV